MATGKNRAQEDLPDNAAILTAEEEQAAQVEVPGSGLDGKYIQYTGTSNVRLISAESWSKIGVEQDDVEWLRDPPHNVVAVRDLSAGALAYLRRDAEFREVEL